MATAQTAMTPFAEPPAWAAEAIWYQIFVERFYNGDKSNDPRPENVNIPFMKRMVPEGWTVTPWTHDWNSKEPWAPANASLNDLLYNRRFGGDLQGVLDKLDYLQDLGVNALFLNPVNDAPSLHKYDARFYHHIDVNFGPDPEGDNKIIASENPNDPATWHWTAADRLFLKLVEEVHRRGMRIIVDYSWNHTGTEFWAWRDVVKNQEKSAYKDWFDIQSFENPGTPATEFSYRGWIGVADLPELKKVKIKGQRESGFPYEGDINEGAKKHIIDVTARWLAPNGDASKGVDGFRLDVADQIGMQFWRDFRKEVRRLKPDAYLVGEIWWENWPDRLMDPVPYTSGDAFDAVMFYQAYRPARYFFAKTDFDIDARQLADSLEFQWNRLSKPVRYAMMNVNASHDAPRLVTCFGNPNKYKHQANVNENPLFNAGAPEAETLQRLRLYLVHLFTTVGAPHIWNGDEMGMWGADDPDCRKPLWWPEYNFAPETKLPVKDGQVIKEKVGFNKAHHAWYKKLAAIRKQNPVLSHGDIAFDETNGKRLVYSRSNASAKIVVVMNAGPNDEAFDIADGNYTDLLTGKMVTSGTLTLRAFSAVVLKAL